MAKREFSSGAVAAIAGAQQRTHDMATRRSDNGGRDRGSGQFPSARPPGS
jgi:hypothetical protein